MPHLEDHFEGRDDLASCPALLQIPLPASRRLTACRLRAVTPVAAVNPLVPVLDIGVDACSIPPHVVASSWSRRRSRRTSVSSRARRCFASLASSLGNAYCTGGSRSRLDHLPPNARTRPAERSYLSLNTIYCKRFQAMSHDYRILGACRSCFLGF